MGKRWSKQEDKILKGLVIQYREKGFDNYVTAEKLKYQFPNRTAEAIRVHISSLMPVEKGDTKKKVSRKVSFSISDKIDKINDLVAKRNEYIKNASDIEIELSKLLRL